MEITEDNFQEICRVCKQKCSYLRSIFENDCPRIDEMLMACTTVVVDFGDGLPESICSECSQQLYNSYKFKQLCETTDALLRNYLISKQVIQNDISVEDNSISPHIDATKTDDYMVIHNDHLNSTASSESVDIRIKEDTEVDSESISEVGDYIKLLENNQLLVRCRTCSKCFTTLDGLKCHKRIHTGSLFKCNTCGKQYTRPNHLQRHELTHGRQKVHMCKICNKTLTRFEHLKRHLITHLKEKPFSCTTCNRGFNRSEHLANHTKRCKGDFVHICDICNKAFNRADSLEVHKVLHDNKLPPLPTLESLNNIDEYYVEIVHDGFEDLPPVSSNDTDEDDEVPEHDSSTGFELPENVSIEEYTLKPSQLPNFGNLEMVLNDINEGYSYVGLDPDELSKEKIKETHEIKYLEEQEPCDSAASVESEYLPKKRMKRRRGRPRKNFAVKHSQKSLVRIRGRPSLKIKNEVTDATCTDQESEFKCPHSECSETFSKSNLLDKHVLTHNDLQLYICAICNKSFARPNHLRRHMVSHSELKPFSCEFCNKRFNRRDHLVQHTKLHVTPQEFECDVCKKLFGRADHLAKHKASKHDVGEKLFGEKKFQCAVCLKCFTTEKYRDIHVKAHMGDKNYTCRICEKSFVSKSHLNEHVKFHNDNAKKFLCSECGQRFIRNDYLVIHMRRHRGEKPFKCKYCGKGFPRTTDLTVHERYHTGEKTHLCPICGRGFGRAYNLTVHMRTHTGEKPYQCTYCDAAFAQGNDLKAHVRRHTGERFHCDFCSKSFLMGYLLTQHKRTVHGLNIVSNIRRLNSIKLQPPDAEPPLTVPLPVPVVPISVFNVQLQTQLEMVELLNDTKAPKLH